MAELFGVDKALVGAWLCIGGSGGGVGCRDVRLHGRRRICYMEGRQRSGSTSELNPISSRPSRLTSRTQTVLAPHLPITASLPHAASALPSPSPQPHTHTAPAS